MHLKFARLALVCLLTIVATATSAAAAPLRIKASTIANSQLPNPEFRNQLRQLFAGQDLAIYSYPTEALPDTMLNVPRTLAAIKQSDIFWYTGHSGISSAGPGKQVLMVRDKVLLEASEVAAALGGKPGPKLILLNGCVTTNPDDGATGVDRFSNAFGVAPGTKKLAYLGWRLEIVGRNADNYVLQLLKNWINGKRTLGEARDLTPKANNEHATIIGDESLRYVDLQ